MFILYRSMFYQVGRAINCPYYYVRYNVGSYYLAMVVPTYLYLPIP